MAVAVADSADEGVDAQRSGGFLLMGFLSIVSGGWLGVEEEERHPQW